MAGLRERKQRTAMRAIQDAALDLFDERGYAAVSVDEIADRAEVSPSSVYRYFGTKGRILVADEHDPWLVRDLEQLLRGADLSRPWHHFSAEYVAQVGATELDPANAQRLLRRLRYVFGEPDVRLALFELFDQHSTTISQALAATGRFTVTQAHVLGHAYVFGYWAVVEQWHAEGATRPLADYVDDGLGVLSVGSARKVKSAAEAPAAPTP